MKDRRIVERRLGEAAAICARAEVRFTALRRGVMALILEAEGPVTAYQLLDRLKETRAGVVPPTIYRSLDFLLARRLIHKVERLNAFVACVDAEHQHHDVQFLICRHCGTVAEIEDRTVAKALAQAAESQGFQTGRAVVELDGTCAACAEPV